MVLIGVLSFAFFLYFGVLVQTIFKCSDEMAFNSSVVVTGLGLLTLLVVLM